ncbi:MAG TPA: Rieske 2Fe-2S domain-containing protein [Vicinamibacteria bacterium]|nr:Rieske 2Fe-2S domain-containing protein [Vicinamibacteria bacterium]
MSEQERNDVESRRSTLKRLAGYLMGGGLVAAYGSLAAVAARFLYPARPAETGFLFVTDLASLGVGESLLYTTPNGATVNVTRKGAGGGIEDFLALSSVCPHLGCQVHWEPQNDRYFCPCHNGIFTPEGVGVGGPPGEAGQSLSQFPLKIENGLLFIEVPLTDVARGPEGPDRISSGGKA